MLKLQDISYSYIDGGSKRTILNDLSFEFLPGKFYTILGPSGSGKTTLLALIAGLDTKYTGNILLNDQDINTIGLDKYRRNKVAIVFQQYNLISYLTALENVQLAMSETDSNKLKDIKSVSYALLDKFGIVKTKADRYVNKLSGGEQQRVAIARAVAKNADIIFADEPTGNLDTETEIEIIKILKMLSEDYNKTVIVVTHSDLVAKMSDHHLKLVDGKLKEH